MAALLELDSVTAGYGRVEVLHDLTLAVPTGSVVAVLGANGAGKTTTLGVVSGTVPVTRGAVRLDGRDVTRKSAYERARLGVTLIPEGRGVFPGLSVRENLAISVRSAQGKDRRWRDEALTRVLDTFPRLRERSDQQAGTLSGGEQQMLAMSRAFLADPRVLLMDEISMGLAPKIVEQLFEAVGELREAGNTIVLVEQYLTYALRFADICYVLAKGRVAFLGEPAELQGSNVLSGYLSA
jgi:branched-chain amino acid transport system ATP-binding protein